MNILDLLANTSNAYTKAPELRNIVARSQELENSISQLKKEIHLLLPQQAHLPETLGIVSSVIDNVEHEIAALIDKRKEIEMSVLTENFIAPIMDEIRKILPYPTRVQINSSGDDIEILIELANPAVGVQTLTLVPDFSQNRVLFVANPELCNLSPLGSLTNSFGHELLIAPTDIKTLIRLLNLK